MIEVIKKPLVSEKNSMVSEHNVYTFEVDRRSNKTDIKKAIEKAFRVKVRSVNTQICRGRAKRTKLGVGKPRYWKKAFIRLQPGEKIALFEGA